MFSELEKLSNLFIVLAVISGVGSVFSFILLHDYWHLLQTDFKPFFFICGYLSVSLPVIFAALAVTVKKIVREMRVKDNYISERIRKLEAQLDK